MMIKNRERMLRHDGDVYSPSFSNMTDTVNLIAGLTRDNATC